MKQLSAKPYRPHAGSVVARLLAWFADENTPPGEELTLQDIADRFAPDRVLHSLESTLAYALQRKVLVLTQNVQGEWVYKLPPEPDRMPG